MALSRITGKWIRVLLHGRSAGRPDVKECVELTRQSGHHVEVRVSWEPGDMRRLACEAVEDGVELLIAGGGDGTISEVVSGLFEATDLVRERPSFGILPLGEVNAFARSCRIPSDPRSAFELVCSAKPLPIDVVRSGSRVLVNIATGGLTQKIDRLKRPDVVDESRARDFFTHCLDRHKPSGTLHASLRGPGFEWAGACLFLAIGNGRQPAEGCTLCPNALLDDGLIDLTVLPKIPREEVSGLSRELRSRGPAAIEQLLIRAQVPWVELDFEEEQQIDFDGESRIQDRFQFAVEEKSLWVHLPEEAPLLRQPRQRIVEFSSFKKQIR